MIRTKQFVFAACMSGLAFADGVKKPDILMIVIDDLNDWSTVFDPANPIQTPNLKRLADRGAFFTQAYAAAPICNPSRSAVWSGLRPTTTGIYGNEEVWSAIIPNVELIPHLFKRNGYETVGAGKLLHHGPNGRDIKERPLVDRYQPLSNELVRRQQAWAASGKTGKPPRRNQMPEGLRGMGSQNYDWGIEEGTPIDQDTTEFAQKVLAEPHDQPRFMAFGIFRPHIPFLAPAQNFMRYPQGILPPMPADDFEDIPAPGAAFIDYLGFQYDYVIKQPPGSPGGLQEMVRCYQAAADYADELVGKMLDALDASGRADNTIIILWSDNGFHLGDKKCVTKLTLWEKACHVPFIIVAPGVTKPGSRINEPVSLVDIYPTLAGLTGFQPAHGLDGENLVPLLKNPNGHSGQYELMSLYKGNHAVRSEFYRYIRYADGSEELYDHRTDPWEHKNLVSNPECKGIIEQHRKFLPSAEAEPGVTIKDLQARGLWDKKSTGVKD